MRKSLTLTALLGAAALLSACGTTVEQRAATGALGGAAAGAVIGDSVGAAAVGAAVGGVAGAATAPENRR